MLKRSCNKQFSARNENGYALLAMLAGLTIALVVLAAAAAKPSVRFESQRENEEEMMYRAVQVANAIQSYAMLKGGVTPQNLPTKMEELADEFNINGKKLHLVRGSAMKDPLTNEDWKPVRLGDPMVKTFLRAYMQELAKKQTEAMASGGAAMAAVAQQQQGLPPLLVMAAQTAGIDINKINAISEEDDDKPTTASGFSLGGDSDSRPIIGVISKSKKQMIRNYYGIESYEKALFVAGIQPNTMSYQMPLIIGGPAPGTTDTTTPGTGSPGGFTKVPCSVNPNQRGCS